jgi:hypothetical protein
VSYLTLFLAFQIDHLDIKINVFNRSSWLPPPYNFTGQKFGIILKDWTSVIKLKNSNGNATITLFTPKVDIHFLILEYSEIQFLLSIS